MLILKEGIFFQYDGNGYTKDAMLEGDHIVSGPTEYLVVSVCDRNILNEFSYYEVGLRQLPSVVQLGVWQKWDGPDAPFTRMVRAIEMNIAGSAQKTLYRLALGAQDPITGWYLQQYILTVAISCPILDAGSLTHYLHTGLYTFYSHLGYTLDDVVEGDIIQDSGSRHEFHRVKEVKTVQIGDHLVYNELKLEYLDPFSVAKFGLGS